MNKQIIFVFDWDDTLFPTSWMSANNIKADDNFTNMNSFGWNNAMQKYDYYSKYFTELDNHMYKLLKYATMIGKVIIITNASKEWILTTSAKLPNTRTIIDSSVIIISARDLYQYKYDMPSWKMKAFNNELIPHLNNANQIITFGDSHFEHQALISLKSMISQNKLKVIRFIQSPEFNVVIDQLDILTRSLITICQTPGPLDIQFNPHSQHVSRQPKESQWIENSNDQKIPMKTDQSNSSCAVMGVDNTMDYSQCSAKGNMQGYGQSLLSNYPTANDNIDWIVRI